MCIGIPMVVEAVNGVSATCVARDCRRQVSLLLVGEDEIAPGMQVLVHQGLALRRIEEDEAALIWQAFDLALEGGG
jgi:hydrogenase expression/formation protein HypC